VLGALALFVYVGVENLALLTVLDYAQDIGMPNPERYTIWPGIGMAAGYILGILCIPKVISQVQALRICTWIAVVDSLLIVLTPPQVSVWCVALLSFACSLMYPAIWPLAIVDLGKFTKKGSSLLVASIGGGALIPLLFGAMKDWAGSQNAYWICLPFYLLIMFYAYYGYRIRK
jgi:fucose permease